MIDAVMVREAMGSAAVSVTEEGVNTAPKATGVTTMAKSVLVGI